MIPRLPRPGAGRIRSILVVCALLALVLAGIGIWAWQKHQAYLASPQAAVDTLNEALASGDMKLFTRAVLCDELACDLARAALPDDPSPEALRRAADSIQLAALAVFRKEPLPDPWKQAVIPVLPDDLLAQWKKKPFALSGVEGVPVASGAVEHPVLGKLPLRLLLRQTGETWMVARLLNGSELVRLYRHAEQEELARRKEKAGLTLEEHRQALGRYLPGLRCRGGVTRISGSVPLLVLVLNSDSAPGPENVDGWGVAFTLTDAAGREMAHPHLTSSGKLLPGSAITETWPVDISEEEYRRLAEAGPLDCRAEPEYALLDDGRIFRIVLP